MNERLGGDPILTLNNDTLQLTLMSGDGTNEPIYSADYELTGAGIITLNATATDFAQNRTDTTESFVSYPTGSDDGTLRSLDGRLRLSVPGDAHTDGQYLLLFECPNPEGKIYDVRPHTMTLAREAAIRFTYHGLTDLNIPGTNYAIFRQDHAGTWTPLRTYFDRDTQDLIAYTDHLGRFQIRVTENATSEPLPRSVFLAQNYPNPFNASTIIEFTLNEPHHVRLEIYNILGEPIAILLDEPRGIGIHRITWDGQTRDNNQAPSGIYFYRLTTESHTETRKMLLVK
jgi:hypothetical protein